MGRLSFGIEAMAPSALIIILLEGKIMVVGVDADRALIIARSDKATIPANKAPNPAGGVGIAAIDIDV